MRRNVLAVILLSSVSLMTAPSGAAAQAGQAAPALVYPKAKTVDVV